MLETSTSRQKLILDAFDAGQLDKIFDWKYWEGIPADAFEIHFAKPRPDGGLDEWGLDFSGKKIEK